jgi:YafQ family addiction module toxin component
MYHYEIIPSLQKTLSKLSKKDKQTFEQVLGKIEEVINSTDVEHYKNLRYSLKDRKRVHVGNFVLVFRLVKEENKVIFLDFDHHDFIYQN